MSSTISNDVWKDWTATRDREQDESERYDPSNFTIVVGAMRGPKLPHDANGGPGDRPLDLISMLFEDDTH